MSVVNEILAEQELLVDQERAVRAFCEFAVGIEMWSLRLAYEQMDRSWSAACALYTQADMALTGATERAEKAERELANCSASVAHAGESAVMDGGLAENIPASVGLALQRMKNRAEKAERERDEARADVERERALREDAETRASICEANHAGQIARLRDERESLRSVTRTWEMRCTEITRQRDAAVRDLAEARESASRYHAELVDSLRAVANERDAAIRERDARPEITVEDAALHEAWLSHPHGEDEPVEMRNAVHRVSVALRAHAARATKGGE